MGTSPPYGAGDFFGMVSENPTEFGTAVDPAVFWRPISNSLKRKDPWRPLSGPTGFAWPMSTLRAFRGKPDISGTVVLEADYDFVGWLLKHTLGTVVGAATDTTALTHSFVMGPSIPTTTATSFTCARGTEFGDDLQYSGCVIEALEFSGAQDRLVTVSADIIAAKGGTVGVPETIGTLSTEPWIEYDDSVFRADFGATGAALDDGDDQTGRAAVTDWTVRIENNYRREQATGDSTALYRGDREYIHAGHRRAILTLSRDYVDDNFFDVYHDSTLADTFATYAIHLLSDEIAGSTTTAYSLDLLFNAGHIVDGMNEYPGGPEALNETITIEAGYNGSDDPFAATLVNQHASY